MPRILFWEEAARFLANLVLMRLLLFDTTDGGLSLIWRAGAWLYRALGRFDAAYGAATWGEGLRWLAGVMPDRQIVEIQYWGHGDTGCILMAHEPLSLTALQSEHPFYAALCAIRKRLTGSDALWWFRTCRTFQGEAGQAFAQAWSAFFGCRTAGYTRDIGLLQGGLHSLSPGQQPAWSVEEGTCKTRFPQWITWAPHTILCFRSRLPEGW